MTKVLVPDQAGIARAINALLASGLVAFPTETVYGLGAVATNDKAVARVFLAKNRPADNPLIAHVASLADASALVVVDDRARALAEAFWPGPLTLVLPSKMGSPVSRLVTAGLPTLALRVPSHPVARALLTQLGLPVAAPSANRSGRISPTRAEHVVQDLGGLIDLVLDAGGCPVGLESTVIDLSVPIPAILRPGGVPREAIERVIGPLGDVEDSSVKRSPGMMTRHYAPGRPMRLDASSAGPREAFLAFGAVPENRALLVRNLSPSGDLSEAASNLFQMLRELDQAAVEAIAVTSIPGDGLGEAINDRLQRAWPGRRGSST